MWYFVEGKIELFKVGEDLVDLQRDVARREVAAMKLNKLVPGQIELLEAGDSGEGLEEGVGVDKGRMR